MNKKEEIYSGMKDKGQIKRVKWNVFNRYVEDWMKKIDKEYSKEQEEAWKIGIEKKEDMETIDGICTNCSKDETDIVVIQVYWGYKTFRCLRCFEKW